MYLLADWFYKVWEKDKGPISSARLEVRLQEVVYVICFVILTSLRGSAPKSGTEKELGPSG